ncbi:Ubiquitin--protein ligase [Bertholletia excelsa]
MTRGRRTRHSSSESIENFFSQQFSYMVNMARQGQAATPDHESQAVDDDSAVRFQHRMRSRVTPNGSRRWRRVLSDNESDGFDSIFGESESNVSFSGYRLFQSESDAISFSAYGGESDASMDGHSLLDAEMFTHPDAGSDLDSDTDIDPMHAGLNHWDTFDQEEENNDEEEDNEWEEADANENAVRSLEAGSLLPSSLSQNEINVPINWQTQVRSPEFVGAIHLRIRERRHPYTPNMFANMEESVVPHFIGNSGDYLDARGFDELLEHLAEDDNSRRGAPPASVSFVNNLPQVVINEEYETQDSLACAICKECLSVGTVVNQLPCGHLYHSSCILPWLRARNSCPLCRYELPTDDKDYEEAKQNTQRNLEIHEIQQQEMSDDDSSDTSDDADIDRDCEFSHDRIVQGADSFNEEQSAGSSGRENRRGGWIFLAAAPIVSLVGIALVLWLGNPLAERRRPVGRHDLPRPGQHPNHSSASWLPNQRENRSRRWWSLFDLLLNN